MINFYSEIGAKFNSVRMKIILLQSGNKYRLLVELLLVKWKMLTDRRTKKHVFSLLYRCDCSNIVVIWNHKWIRVHSFQFPPITLYRARRSLANCWMATLSQKYFSLSACQSPPHLFRWRNVEDILCGYAAYMFYIMGKIK